MKQGEDLEELEANAEDQHLDAGVEVRAHKTYRTGDAEADAPAAAPEQMQTEEVHEQVMQGSR